MDVGKKTRHREKEDDKKGASQKRVSAPPPQENDKREAEDEYTQHAVLRVGIIIPENGSLRDQVKPFHPGWVDIS